MKIRTGPPDDGDTPDAALPVWAGVLPLAAVWQAPDPDPAHPADIPLPPHIATMAGEPRWPLIRPDKKIPGRPTGRQSRSTS